MLVLAPRTTFALVVLVYSWQLTTSWIWAHHYIYYIYSMLFSFRLRYFFMCHWSSFDVPKMRRNIVDTTHFWLHLCYKISNSCREYKRLNFTFFWFCDAFAKHNPRKASFYSLSFSNFVLTWKTKYTNTEYKASIMNIYAN